MHFGELGNISYLRPNYAKAVADVVKELGGKPFLTDCNTMYPGSRKNALEHLECAWENGFTPLTVGCPILIGDGLKGTDDVDVPVEGGEYVKEAKIGRAIMDADVFISLTHFKGHEMTGFGGTIKNIGMGCGSRAGKKTSTAAANHTLNRIYVKAAANVRKNVPTVVWSLMKLPENACGSGTLRRLRPLLGACNFDAIAFDNDTANELLNCRMAEYTKAV